MVYALIVGHASAAFSGEIVGIIACQGWSRVRILSVLKWCYFHHHQSCIIQLCRGICVTLIHRHNEKVTKCLPEKPVSGLLSSKASTKCRQKLQTRNCENLKIPLCCFHLAHIKTLIIINYLLIIHQPWVWKWINVLKKMFVGSLIENYIWNSESSKPTF